MALAIIVGGEARAAPDGKNVPRVAFFGFQLTNSSPEQTRPDEIARIRLLDDLFREKLDASNRFTIVAIPAEIGREVATGPAIGSCNGCERDFARRIGATLAAWGTVRKVSNLILHINVYMVDAEAGKMEFVRGVSIRGNTDESWRRGLDYLLRNYLLGEP